MRQELHDHLVKINPDKNWDFIINQIGWVTLLLLGSCHASVPAAPAATCVLDRAPLTVIPWHLMFT